MGKKQVNIPNWTKPYFWDVNLEDLDINEHRIYIIERLLNEGDHHTLIWVFQTYSEEMIREAVTLGRGLSRKTARCWQNYFGLKEDEMRCFGSSDIPRFNIASGIDIGLMKWNAICNRGARKDFIDLYVICQEGITMAKLLDLMPKKFPGVDLNYYHLIKSLTYFEDAERELMPVMKKLIEWDDVKSYFQMIQKELLEKIKKDTKK